MKQTRHQIFFFRNFLSSVDNFLALEVTAAFLGQVKLYY